MNFCLTIQALVYAGPGALYAAHLVLPLLLILAVHLPPIPSLLAFTTLLWFHPLNLLQDDVAAALFLQLLDINSILANQLATKVVRYVELITHKLSLFKMRLQASASFTYQVTLFRANACILSTVRSSLGVGL